MISELKQHKAEYAIFFLYSLISFVLFFGYQTNSIRFRILGLYLAFYFSWSIIHHLINKNLTLLVFLEYLLITVLAIFTLKVVFFPNI